MLAHPRDERVVLRRAHVHLALAQARALFPGSRLVFMFIRQPNARASTRRCRGHVGTWDERPVRRTRAGIVVVLLHIRSAHVIFRAKADSTAGFKCDEVPSRLLVLVNKANKAESGHGAVSLRGLLQLFNRRPHRAGARKPKGDSRVTAMALQNLSGMLNRKCASTGSLLVLSLRTLCARESLPSGMRHCSISLSCNENTSGDLVPP